MNALLRILIAVLVVCDVSMSAEQTSFGDLAREAEKRKETAERPAKTYTNDDLRPVEPTPSAGRSAAGCQSEHKYDPTSGDTQLIARCSDGTTRVQGSNTRTGWNGARLSRRTAPNPEWTSAATDGCMTRKQRATRMKMAKLGKVRVRFASASNRPCPVLHNQLRGGVLTPTPTSHSVWTHRERTQREIVT